MIYGAGLLLCATAAHGKVDTTPAAFQKLAQSLQETMRRLGVAFLEKGEFWTMSTSLAYGHDKYWDPQEYGYSDATGLVTRLSKRMGKVTVGFGLESNLSLSHTNGAESFAAKSGYMGYNPFIQYHFTPYFAGGLSFSHIDTNQVYIGSFKTKSSRIFDSTTLSGSLLLPSMGPILPSLDTTYSFLNYSFSPQKGYTMGTSGRGSQQIGFTMMTLRYQNTSAFVPYIGFGVNKAFRKKGIFEKGYGRLGNTLMLGTSYMHNTNSHWNLQYILNKEICPGRFQDIILTYSTSF